jgi:hypothetical protein
MALQHLKFWDPNSWCIHTSSITQHSNYIPFKAHYSCTPNTRMQHFNILALNSKALGSDLAMRATYLDCTSPISLGPPKQILKELLI